MDKKDDRTGELVKLIRSGLKEWAVLNEAAMIVKDRIRQGANSDVVPYISSSDLKTIQAPESKWNEVYHLIMSAQPD